MRRTKRAFSTTKRAETQSEEELGNAFFQEASRRIAERAFLRAGCVCQWQEHEVPTAFFLRGKRVFDGRAATRREPFFNTELSQWRRADSVRLASFCGRRSMLFANAMEFVASAEFS